MKNLLVINPIPLICSIKKLIFVYILLLILPLTGCKSVVKETIVYPNGDKYVGEFKDGKFHGQGTKTWSDGMYVGKYKDGKLWTGIFYDKNRKTSFKVVNGRMIKQ